MKKCAGLIILSFIFSTIACSANVFPWNVEKYDLWGRAILVSKDGMLKETAEGSRKKLCEIYYSSDFWDLVKETSETKDLQGISILSAIWLDIASSVDRKRIVDAIFTGCIGETLSRKSRYGIFNSIYKVKYFLEENPSPGLCRDITLILIDYYCFESLLRLFTGNNSFHLSSDDFAVAFCSRWKALNGYSGGHTSAFAVVSGYAHLYKFLGFADPEFCLWFDVLAREYAFPDWCSSENNLVKIEKLIGENDSAVRFSRALRTGDESAIINLAHEHFSPAYPHAADYYFRKKMYQDSAYFYYLYLRHPVNFYRMATFSSSCKVMQSVIFPITERFSNALLLSGNYKDLIGFISYFKAMVLTQRKHAILVSEMNTMSDKVKNEVLRNNGAISYESENIGQHQGTNLDYFYIQDFEERYQKELSEFAKSW